MEGILQNGGIPALRMHRASPPVHMILHHSHMEQHLQILAWEEACARDCCRIEAALHPKNGGDGGGGDGDGLPSQDMDCKAHPHRDS